MADWLDFHGALDLDAVVPEAFARYRPAVADGLLFFLDNLSPARAAALLAEQAAMPSNAGTGERLVAIARRCPALHKLGQVLARDRRLPTEFRRLLQTLETIKPTSALEELRPALESALGPAAAADLILDEEPLAEASVAIVIPFARSMPGGARQRGVLKLLKEGVEEKLEEELQILQRMGAVLDERCEAYGLPAINYADSFSQVRDLLEQEVRLDREQAHMEAARASYAEKPSVIIPEVFDISTPRMTAMERIDGIKVTDVDKTMAPKSRRALAERIVDALIAHPLWACDGKAMFHADPHAGNLLVTADGKLAILDWSLVGTLSEAEQGCLAQVLLGALTLDAARVTAAIGQLSDNTIDTVALRAVVDGHVRRLPAGTRPGLAWLTELMDDAVLKAGGRFAADPIMFRKVIQTLKGVVADTSDDTRIDRVLATAFVKQLAREWARRSVSAPFSRDFPTRVSNADLWHLTLSAPLTGLRYLQTMQHALLAQALPA